MRKLVVVSLAAFALFPFAAHARGWDQTPEKIESSHWLPNDYEQTWEISAPENTTKFRLQFGSIHMEKDYDFVVVEDGNGNEIEKITGYHLRYQTLPIYGDSARIRVVTDGSVRSWGFRLEAVEHRGCTPEPVQTEPPIAASSCSELLSAIQEVALEEVDRRFSMGGGVIWWNGPIAMESTRSELSHSETNVQVEGIDEPDIVKTDGNFIYAVAGRRLHVYRSWPAEETELLYSVDIEGMPQELFLDGDRAVVISGVSGVGQLDATDTHALIWAPGWWSSNAFTKLTVLDVGGLEKSEPEVVDEVLLAGRYDSARADGDTFTFVLQRQLQWPQINYYPQGVTWGTHEYEEALERLEAEAIDAVMAQSLEDWLPSSYRVVDGERVQLPVDCNQYLGWIGSTETAMTAVASVHLGGKEPVVDESVLQGGISTLYQSSDSIYVANRHVSRCAVSDAGLEGQHTYVHKLHVSEQGDVGYDAFGVVEGLVPSQFGLDEHDEYLRVATQNSRWAATEPEDRVSNQVFVLAETGKKRLEIVGSTPLLAPGEMLRGVRFVGNMGFVVTFRQVDPLFTLDLSQPTSPRVVGELKVPGFSTYLHVLDEDHLFAIGQDFDEDGTTRNGVALSIFDVSDLAHPRLAHKAVVGTRSGYSEALYEHHAFTLYQVPGESEPTLAIPFTDWDWNADDPWARFTSTLKLFNVSPDEIRERGELSLAGLFEQNQVSSFGWWYRPNVRRGLFVEDYVFAISDAGLRVARVTDLSKIVAEASVPPQHEQPPQSDPSSPSQSAPVD